MLTERGRPPGLAGGSIAKSLATVVGQIGWIDGLHAKIYVVKKSPVPNDPCKYPLFSGPTRPFQTRSQRSVVA